MLLRPVETGSHRRCPLVRLVLVILFVSGSFCVPHVRICFSILGFAICSSIHSCSSICGFLVLGCGSGLDPLAALGVCGALSFALLGFAMRVLLLPASAVVAVLRWSPVCSLLALSLVRLSLWSLDGLRTSWRSHPSPSFVFRRSAAVPSWALLAPLLSAPAFALRCCPVRRTTSSCPMTRVRFRSRSSCFCLGRASGGCRASDLLRFDREKMASVCGCLVVMMVVRWRMMTMCSLLPWFAGYAAISL